MYWYLEALKKYAVFSGRARRKEYWVFVLFNVLIALTLGAIEGLSGINANSTRSVLADLYALAVLIPSIAVGVRRLQDTGRNGWWIMLAFVPLGGLVLLAFFVQDGNRGPNTYGPDPKVPNHVPARPAGPAVSPHPDRPVPAPSKSAGTLSAKSDTHQVGVVLARVRRSGLPLRFAQNRLWLDTVGEMTPAQVASRDRRGALVWADDAARQWFMSNYPEALSGARDLATPDAIEADAEHDGGIRDADRFWSR